MLLSVVVPAYSSADDVGKCVDALARAVRAVPGETEIVVVANRALEGLDPGPGARVLEPGENLGFAGGVMHGIRQSSGSWVAVVNDDCVVEPSGLAALLAAADDERIGSVAGLVLFAGPAAVVNSAGLSVDALGVASERLVGRPPADAEAGEVFGATGALGLFRRAMLDDVGGFDESFFAYLEDADLAWRARMAGWRCVFTPEARAVHAHSATLGHGSGAKYRLIGRNRVRMLAKNATTRHLCRRAAAMVLYDLGYVAYAAVRSRTLAPLLGRLDGLREWRRYRVAGSGARASVRLDPPPGLRAALGRDRAYRSGSVR